MITNYYTLHRFHFLSNLIQFDILFEIIAITFLFQISNKEQKLIQIKLLKLLLKEISLLFMFFIFFQGHFFGIVNYIFSF